MGQLLRGGAANAACYGLLSAVSAGFLLLVRWASLDAAAAAGVGLAVYGFLFSGLLGLSQAVQAVTSRRLGEGRTDLLALNARVGLLVALPLVAGAAVLLWACPDGLLRLVCGSGGQWQTMAATLPVVFAFLGVLAFGEAVYANFSAALRSDNQFGFLCATTLILGTVLLGGTYLAARLGAGLPTFLTLLCAYTLAQGVATLLRFRRTTGILSGAARPAPVPVR
jgi:Na+-driven multidrug efflux pump